MVPDMKGLLSENDCTKFFEVLLADLSWEWDSRFETALAQISIKEGDVIQNTLESHLGTAWDSDSIHTAPESVHRVLARLGGIMSNQLFYAAGLPNDGIVFCAWWPWGNGQTISVRIGTTQEDLALLETLVPLDAR